MNNFTQAFNWASKPKPFNPCSTNCLSAIHGLIWIQNQPFWTYQCACCGTYQFKPGKASSEGGLYG